MPVPKASNLPSTQAHLDIEDITDDLVLLKNGGAALILQTTAVNFGLLSETEQDAAIYAYAGLLNSLTFSVQIVIRSRRMDISSYLELLSAQEERQTNEGLRYQTKKYREFVESIIKENEVLDKRFYIVIPFSPLELGVRPAAASFLDLLNPFAKKKRGGLPFPKDYILEKAKNALYPKKDHIMRQMARIGLKAEQLTTQQLVELFYDIYNPVQVGGQRLTARATDYLAPVVAPATEEPTVPTAAEVETPAPVKEERAAPWQVAATSQKAEEKELKKEKEKSEEILYKG